MGLLPCVHYPKRKIRTAKSPLSPNSPGLSIDSQLLLKPNWFMVSGARGLG